jgi:RNA polymerase sigma-70 factor (ECF subfamily)
MVPQFDPPVKSESLDPSSAPQRFDTTHWSVVAQAQGGSTPEAQAALATLCETYWYPVYVYVRRRSASDDEAEESTQEFFTRLLEKGFVGDAERGKGRFRTFLLACCQHFLANQRKHAGAKKRGGGQTILSLDVTGARQRYLSEQGGDSSPEQQFDRRWALTLLERGLHRLGQEYQRENKKALYDELKCHLVGESNPSSYAEVAERLGTTEGAVKKAAQRLRDRCGAIVREEILATVQSPELVEEEIRELFAVLGG